jgi:DNA replication and repair protein RecF
MRVTQVETLGFRNLADAALELGEGVTLLWGDNGAGKTNALEAVFAALTGRSPRTRSERELIRFGDPVARTEAEVADGGDRRRFLFAIERSGDRRQLLDGAVAGAEQAPLRPALSLFMPDRLALIKGPPAGRRAHLDRFCAALWPSRDDARRRYARALAQRNALLGRIRAGTAAEDSLEAWEQELAATGIELIECRAKAVSALAPGFAEATAGLGLGDEGTISYRPRSEASAAAELAAELAERREGDVERGFTTHGPHLDDVAIERGGRSLRRYGSQGQQRTGLLALLFAERDALAAAGRTQPLLLLDDVTSELDPDARQRLVQMLDEAGGQAIVTATEPDQLPAGAGDRAEIRLRDGAEVSLTAVAESGGAGLAAA